MADNEVVSKLPQPVKNQGQILINVPAECVVHSLDGEVMTNQDFIELYKMFIRIGKIGLVNDVQCKYTPLELFLSLKQLSGAYWLHGVEWSVWVGIHMYTLTENKNKLMHWENVKLFSDKNITQLNNLIKWGFLQDRSDRDRICQPGGSPRSPDLPVLFEKDDLASHNKVCGGLVTNGQLSIYQLFIYQLWFMFRYKLSPPRAEGTRPESYLVLCEIIMVMSMREDLMKQWKAEFVPWMRESYPDQRMDFTVEELKIYLLVRFRDRFLTG
jgi:hypothetical protein